VNTPTTPPTPSPAQHQPGGAHLHPPMLTSNDAHIFTTNDRQQLFAALDLQLVYKKDTHQVTIYVTITPATPYALAAIITASEPPTSANIATLIPFARNTLVSWWTQP
jgi:hypothetical protein